MIDRTLGFAIAHSDRVDTSSHWLCHKGEKSDATRAGCQPQRVHPGAALTDLDLD